jgi:ATP-dependent helicase/nuclease subunit A
VGRQAPSVEQEDTLPDWATRPAKTGPGDTPAISPRTLAATRSCLVADASAEATTLDAALRRGRLVHLLLEQLPNVRAPAWRDAAPKIAALEAQDVPDGELQEAYAEAERVLTAPGICGMSSRPTRWPRSRFMARARF